MSVQISIEPSEQAEKREPISLGEQISRIAQERGSFAGLTEAKLETAIAHGQEEEDANMELDEHSPGEGLQRIGPTEEDDTVDDTKKESFDELRTQLAGRVATALNESALNLDFVSLLVSMSRPQAGTSSMSPMLKSQIPPGSLNADTVETPVPSASVESAYGWKISAYKRAAEHLEFASSRLKKEVRKEATFWKDMLITTRSGENVNRKMVVKYGYGDSGSSYFDKGWGKLESDDESGHVVFVPQNKLENKFVRVSIFANNKPPDLTDETPEHTPEPERLVGQAVLNCRAEGLEELPEPVRSIRTERDRLFEHELMYQLIQEARRDLAPHKVRLADGKIVCDLFDGHIEIDLFETSEAAPAPTANCPAAALCYCLHLLLTEHYKAVLQRKQEHPQPLTSAKHEPAPLPSILKPALAHVHLSILVNRTLRLVNLMLPESKADIVEAYAPSLAAAPHCVIHVKYAEKVLELRLSSPLHASEEPVFHVNVQGTKQWPAEFYDLTELELWLKWVTR